MIGNPAQEISQTPPGGSYRLVDHHGHDVTHESYFGYHVLVFFGFTHCRVVCPRTLGKLSRVLDALGPLADRIRALYITVDPERDTPSVMRAFLELQYPRFTGLTGTREQVDAAKATFHVFAPRTPDPEREGDYAMAHTAMTFLLDESGAYAAHFPYAFSETQMALQLKALLSSAGGG